MPWTVAASPCTVVMHGDVGRDRRRPDLVAVQPRRPARGRAVRRVDHQVDLAGQDAPDDGRLAVGSGPGRVLAHDGRRHAVAAQHLGRARGGEDLEAEVGQPLDREDHVPLVAVGHRHERPTAGRQSAERRRLRLGERRAEGRVEAHHLAGATASPGRGRCRRCVPSAVRNRLNGITASLTATGASSARSPPSPVGAQQPLGPQVGDRRAEHDPRGRLGQRGGGRLGDERHGTRRPRVGLEDVEHVGRDRELDVEQAAHADAVGDGPRRLADALDVLATQRDRRQRARRVAGVDAGLLDVLHHAAEVELVAVVQRVDVDLDRVVEEPVDEHRVAGRDLGRPLDVGRAARRRRRRSPCRGRRARTTAGPAPGSRSRRRSPWPR